jgi:hypothetical protein
VGHTEQFIGLKQLEKVGNNTPKASAAITRIATKQLAQPKDRPTEFKVTVDSAIDVAFWFGSIK